MKNTYGEGFGWMYFCGIVLVIISTIFKLNWNPDTMFIGSILFGVYAEISNLHENIYKDWKNKNK